jgi:hypothetical protein
MSFAVGQKIVCIDDSWTVMDGSPVPASAPKKGEVCVCAGYKAPDDVFGRLLIAWGTRFIFLAEAPGGWSFEEASFRPLVERKTDITIFEQLLTPAKPKELVDT